MIGVSKTSRPRRLAVRELGAARHPAPVELDLPVVAQTARAAEHELRTRAANDPNRCSGYFPALAGQAGIVSDLPACQSFAARSPHISCGGYRYEFNFLRLSLVQQSTDVSYHLDSDAATALSGDVAALGRREIRRLLLNLSLRSDRDLHYLNLDPRSVELAVDRSYIRAADPRELRGHGLIATIPRRSGSTVHGLVFASNLVLHSGLDDEHGHFVAAYGIETATEGSDGSGLNLEKALSTRSRSSH